MLASAPERDLATGAKGTLSSDDGTAGPRGSEAADTPSSRLDFPGANGTLARVSGTAGANDTLASGPLFASHWTFARRPAAPPPSAASCAAVEDAAGRRGHWFAGCCPLHTRQTCTRSHAPVQAPRWYLKHLALPSGVLADSPPRQLPPLPRPLFLSPFLYFLLYLLSHHPCPSP